MRNAKAVRAGTIPAPVETKWRFDADDLEAVARWLGSAVPSSRLRVARGHFQRLQDCYLDTKDWRIFRAGYVLRLRRANDTCVATLKGRTTRGRSLAVRRELTQAIAVPTAAAIFAEAGAVRNVLEQLARPRALRVRAEIVTRRRTFTLTTRHSSVGNLALDHSRVLVQRPPRPLLRVEVEVPQGFVSNVQPFVKVLRDALALRPALLSKAAWAFAAHGDSPAGPPAATGRYAVRDGQTTRSAARAVLLRQLAALIWNEPGVRLAEHPVFVHDMRVATRRLLAALRLFKGVAPPATTRRLRDRLRAVAEALGRVRDLEVFLEAVATWHRSTPARTREALHPFLAGIGERRDTALAQLHAFMDSARLHKLETQLKRALRKPPPARGSLASEPISIAAPRLIHRAQQRLMRRARRLDKHSGASAFHAVRILGKRLRYTLEFLEPVCGSGARPLIRSLVDLQNNLGLQQDGEVARQLIGEFTGTSRPSLPAATQRAMNAMSKEFARREGRLRRRVPELIKHVSRAEMP